MRWEQSPSSLLRAGDLVVGICARDKKVSSLTCPIKGFGAAEVVRGTGTEPLLLVSSGDLVVECVHEMRCFPLLLTQ